MVKQDVVFVVGSTDTLHCDGCTACCRWGAVVLQLNDRAEDYETEALADLTILKRQADGRTCWYLGDKGCTIYEKRPTVCRAFDCRVYGLLKTGSKIEDRDREVLLAGKERLLTAVGELRL